MALGPVQPVTGGPADDFLRQTGNVAVGDVDKLLQGRGVTEVPEMEAKTFGEDLDRETEREIGIFSIFGMMDAAWLRGFADREKRGDGGDRGQTT